MIREQPLGSLFSAVPKKDWCFLWYGQRQGGVEEQERSGGRRSVRPRRGNGCGVQEDSTTRRTCGKSAEEDQPWRDPKRHHDTRPYERRHTSVTGDGGPRPHLGT